MKIKRKCKKLLSGLLTGALILTSANIGTPLSVSADTISGTGSMSSFQVDLFYANYDWSEFISGGNAVTVTSNGEYEISCTTTTGVEDINCLWLDTNLYDGSFTADFNIQATEVAVGESTYTLATGSGYLSFADSNYDNALRTTIRNPYINLVDTDLISY